MRQIAIAALLLIPTPSGSWAEGLPISCLYEKTAGQAVATCKIKNTSERAIAKIEYQIEVVSIGREVPWGSATGEIDIPGGIEPAEELTLGFPAPSLPQRAPAEGIKASNLQRCLESLSIKQGRKRSPTFRQGDTAQRRCRIFQ